MCLRILLLNTPGATGFNDLKTHEGITYLTYQECAIERGLLADDKIWSDTLIEAALVTTNIHQFRTLFVMILVFGAPSNPKKLFDAHLPTLAEDIIQKEKIRLNTSIIAINQEIINLTIFYLNELLQDYNKTTQDFHGLPILPIDYNLNTNQIFLNNIDKNKFITEQKNYDKEALKIIHDRSKKLLNNGQLNAYIQIFNSKNNLFFIDGPGNTI